MEIIKDRKTALLFGATGLVGGHCLRLLLNHPAYAKVVVFTRRKLDMEHPRLVQHLVNFQQLPDYRSLLHGHDLYLCLGTTMAQAGSQAAFFKVDYTYPYQAARMSLENKVNQVLLVSSVGADPKSLFFYSKVKGLLEQELKKMPFWAVHIFRPSVLLGERNDNRWGEKLAARLGRGLDNITGGMLSKYRPIEAEIVAQAMVNAAQHLEDGVFTYPSDYLQQLAEESYNQKPSKPL